MPFLALLPLDIDEGDLDGAGIDESDHTAVAEYAVRAIRQFLDQTDMTTLWLIPSQDQSSLESTFEQIRAKYCSDVPIF